MAKLADYRCMVRDPSSDRGEWLSFDSSIYVDSTGVFSCTYPEYLQDCVSSLARAEGVEWERKVQSKGFVWRVYGLNLQKLKDFLKAALFAFATPAVEREPVIRYNVKSQVAFVQAGDEIYADGYGAGANYEGQDPDRPRGRWVSEPFYGQHVSNTPARGGYSIIVGAEACMKVKTTFGDKVKVTYERWQGPSDGAGHKLNQWQGFILNDKDTQEIPYTEEAALFFNNMMYSIAKLAKQLHDHLGSPERVQLAIAQGSKNLLGVKDT